ncbi:MAG: chemotaxis protein CheW [Thiotrichaceae bacterium]|nr:chemotaxis protein CheW [Thiotrichaceae bacterium]
MDEEKRVSTPATDTPWQPPSGALTRPLNRKAEEAAWGLAQSEISRRMGFRIANIGLLIGENIISELKELEKICSIPNTSEGLLGLINLRGNLVPVFDLYTLLRLPRMAESRRRRDMLLILGEGEKAGAILIEELPVHIAFTNEDKLEILPVLPDAIQNFTSNGYTKEGEVWFNFDHLGFFESLAKKVAA